MNWRIKKEWVLIAFAILFLWPLLYHHAPCYYYYPDIQFVKAKLLWVMAGDLYGDPITGMPTFHPPYYHLFLGLFVKLGIGIYTLLFLVSVLNVVLILYFTHRIARNMFDDQTAFWIVLLVPFLIRFMGPDNAFLPSSFYFSFPFYLAGLWLYVKTPAAGMGRLAATSILWGLAFLISPVYVFLIGFTFAYELFFAGDFRRGLIRCAVFLIVIIPFFVQAITVTQAGMTSTEAFTLWPGVPDGEWLRRFYYHLTMPSHPEIVTWHIGLTSVLIALGVFSMWKSRPLLPYAFIAMLAYVFTAYHFKPQYSGRVLFFLTLILIGYTVHYLKRFERQRIVLFVLILILAGYGFFESTIYAHHRLNHQDSEKDNYNLLADDLWQQLPQHIPAGSTIMAVDRTYLHFILPAHRLHTLIAYKSSEYFQVGTELSNEILGDYNMLMNAASPATVDWICDKYDISAAVAGEYRDMKMLGFQTISEYWTLAYRNNYFRIYLRPKAGPSGP